MSQRLMLMTAGVVLIASSVWAQSAPIKIAVSTPYLDNADIPTNVIEKCTALGTKLSAFTRQYAAKDGLSLVQEPQVDSHSAGRVFVMQITHVVSRGNAFIGHQKSMSAKGELFVNGKSRGVANFTRDSMGGFGGGFKGSCSVLGRTTKALGRDLANWLKEHS
ncbi:MAG: hypothetical protein V3T07_01270 [Myxococcota bacterium]